MNCSIYNKLDCLKSYVGYFTEGKTYPIIESFHDDKFNATYEIEDDLGIRRKVTTIDTQGLFVGTIDWAPIYKEMPSHPHRDISIDDLIEKFNFNIHEETIVKLLLEAKNNTEGRGTNLLLAIRHIEALIELDSGIY